MKKIKWSYDKKFKQWFVPSTIWDADDSFIIKKEDKEYKLSLGYIKVIGRFKKLSSAKTVANLLRHG